MTVSDNEIIKALGFCCGDTDDDNEKDCDNMCYQNILPEDRNGDTRWCRQWLMKDALDLINRLKSTNEKNERIIELNDKLIKTQSAEIERLQKESESKEKAYNKEYMLRKELKAEIERSQKGLINNA